MANFNIIFDRSDHKYSPGDIINLDIHVEVEYNTKYRSIYVMLQGFAHVEWTECKRIRNGRNRRFHNEYTTYFADKTFISKHQTLAGSEGGPDIRLSAGSHTFHATFQLPENVPQNYEDGISHIRYEVKVRIDSPDEVVNKKTVPITLSPRVDLNKFMHMHLKTPVRDVASRTFSFCCWKSKPLLIYNVLPCSGFVPGNSVQYILELNNESDVPISYATVQLVEKIVYHADFPHSKTREIHRTLWERELNVRADQLMIGISKKSFSTNLHFDSSWNFHFFNGCGIITVEYYLKSKVRTSGCYGNVSNYTSITMGTIPFRNSEDLPVATLENVPMQITSSPANFPSAPVEPIADHTLPSYDDVMASSIGAIGLKGSNDVDTPPPSFTEIDLAKHM